MNMKLGEKSCEMNEVDEYESEWFLLKAFGQFLLTELGFSMIRIGVTVSPVRRDWFFLVSFNACDWSVAGYQTFFPIIWKF